MKSQRKTNTTCKCENGNPSSSSCIYHTCDSIESIIVFANLYQNSVSLSKYGSVLINDFKQYACCSRGAVGFRSR